MCDVDELRYLEIGNMLNELGGDEFVTLCYKVPNSNLQTGLCPLMSDVNVLQITKVVPLEKIVHVYVVKENLKTQEYFAFQQYDLSFIDNPNHIEFERSKIETLLELEGMYNHLSDVEHVKEQIVAPAEEQDEVEDDSSYGDSFHGDSSNIDSTDEDVTTWKNGDHPPFKGDDIQGGGFGDFDFDVTSMTIYITKDQTTGHEEEFSDYDDSDVERMAVNSSDDDDMIKYLVFNEETYMRYPQFELWNFGARVKFNSEERSRGWKIYASLVRNTSSVQVRTLVSKYTCFGVSLGYISELWQKKQLIHIHLSPLCLKILETHFNTLAESSE
ncbi:hypothetical protein AgCh_035161 [Apium graveolens]